MAALSPDDRLAVLDVVTRADQAASDRDAASYVQLFTDDVLLEGSQGRHVGREALRTAVGPIWAAEGAATLHLTLNPIIDANPEQADEVIVWSVLMIVDPAVPVTIRTVATITQTLRRQDGGWLIRRRTVASAGPPSAGPA